MFGQTIFKVKHIENYGNHKINSDAKAPDGYQVIINKAITTIVIKNPTSDDMNFKISSKKKENGIYIYDCVSTTKNGSAPVFIHNDITKKTYKIIFPEDIEDNTGNYTLLIY